MRFTLILPSNFYIFLQEYPRFNYIILYRITVFYMSKLILLTERQRQNLSWPGTCHILILYFNLNNFNLFQ